VLNAVFVPYPACMYNVLRYPFFLLGQYVSLFLTVPRLHFPLEFVPEPPTISPKKFPDPGFFLESPRRVFSFLSQERAGIPFASHSDGIIRADWLLLGSPARLFHHFPVLEPAQACLFLVNRSGDNEVFRFFLVPPQSLFCVKAFTQVYAIVLFYPRCAG